MPTTITLAPVGAGKTAIALDRLAHTLDHTPFAKVWVLLASKRQEHAFRQRLVEQRLIEMKREVYFNVEFFNFYELYQRILDMHGTPQRDLSDTARYSLLRDVISELHTAGKLKVFHTIAETPGFVRIVADFIFELKQNRVEPDKFLAVANQTTSYKDDDLALIYQGYQERLIKHDLVDIEGEGWLAVNALRKKRELADDLALLIVDGFDQFTTVQADLMTLLAERADESLITLTTVPGDDRKSVNRRFQRALDVLKDRFPDHLYTVETLEAGHGAQRRAHLQHLVAHIFRREINTPPPDDDSCISLTEAPDTASEVGAILRQVKRLLLAGESPEEIMIALRDWSRYYTHLLTYKQVYGLPLVLHYGEPLLENPAIATLMHLLTLSERDFRYRDVIDVLRSRYLDVPELNDPDIAMIEKIGLKYQVVGGREAWIDAIFRASQPDMDSDEDETLLTVEEAENLSLDIEKCFDAVTLPENATLTDYIYALETLIGPDPLADLLEDEADKYEPEMGGFTLNMIARIRDRQAPERVITRDMIAMHTFKRVLRGLISAQELIDSLKNSAGATLTRDEFLTDLTTALNRAAINARPNRAGQVLVTTAADARGLPHNHVFIVGLSEGIFPSPTPEDPLYLDSERHTLNALGIPLLTQAERAADDSLFYELICLPRETLTLSRPTTQDGKPWIESHLWRAVRAVYEAYPQYIQTENLRIGEVTPADQVASMDEVALAVADGLSHGKDDVHGLYNWLHTTPVWARIYAGREIEAGRLARDMPYDRYTGKLHDDAVISHIADQMRPDDAWSASRLNDYGVCGFRYFSKRLLDLQSLEEPEAGLDVLQYGSLNHKVLEETYHVFKKEGIALIPENIAYAQAIFERIAPQVMDEYVEQYALKPGVMWEQEKSRLIHRLSILLNKDFSNDAKENPVLKGFKGAELSGVRRPHKLEVHFGGSRVVTMPLPNGETIHLKGVIDRIDLIDDHKAIILDYKSGSTAIKVEEMSEGRNFQMMVYLVAAQHLLSQDGIEVVGGGFWHLTDYAVKGVVRLDEASGLEAIDSAREHIEWYLALGRRGDFAVHANQPDGGKCVRYCEFHHFCRMSSTHPHKSG